MGKQRLTGILTASALYLGIFLLSHGNAQACSQRIAHPSQRVNIDTSGNVWVSGSLNYTLYRYSPDGQTVDAFDISQWGAYGAYGVAVTPVDNDVWVAEHVSGLLRKYNSGGTLDPASPFDMQIGYNRGVAVTPIDNHIWVAHTGWNLSDFRVTRYSNDGTMCEEIVPGGFGPSVLAVDAGSRVWVTSSTGRPASVERIGTVTVLQRGSRIIGDCPEWQNNDK